MKGNHPNYETPIGYSLEGLLVDALKELTRVAAGDGWEYFLKYVCCWFVRISLIVPFNSEFQV